MAKWTPDKVEEACGVPEAQVFKVAEMMAKNRPSHARLVHGPDAAHDRQRDGARLVHRAARARQHRRVRRRRQHLPRPRQRAGRDRRRPEPRFAARLLRHRRQARGSTSPTVWGVDYEWIKKQFASQAMMDKPGMTVSRWIDGVLEKNELIDQDTEPARRWSSGAMRRTRRRAAWR